MYAVRIQSVLRGYFVRQFVKLSGWYRYKRDECVNDSDFYILERFDEFPSQFLFFHPSGSRHYGFHIGSLVTMLQKQGSVMNSYTREQIDSKIITRVYCLLHILFPEVVALHKECLPVLQTGGLNVAASRIVLQEGNETVSPWYQRIDYLHILVESSEFYTQRQCDLLMKLAFLQTLTIERRMIELFIDIDLMGNYTNAEWFIELSRHQLHNLYIHMQSSWGQIPQETQRLICILGNPFDAFQIYNAETMPLHEWRMVCITIMELMTYCGETVEDQKIGIYHILYGLSNISRRARESLRHLL
jgi:hypothetical protein